MIHQLHSKRHGTIKVQEREKMERGNQIGIQANGRYAMIFLHGQLEEGIVVKRPPGYVEYLKEHC